MRIAIIAFSVIIAAITVGLLILPKLTGPKFLVVPVGEVGGTLSTSKRFKVKSPSNSAWFSSLRLVVESGTLEEQDNVEIEVLQGGQAVFKRVFPANFLLQSDPVRKKAFSIFLTGAAVNGTPKEEFGYGKEFEISARLLNSSNTHILIYATFVDDRWIKN